MENSKIDYKGTLKEVANLIAYSSLAEDITEAMKRAVSQALTIILEDVAVNATPYHRITIHNEFVGVDEQSILGRADELKKKLGITT
jgi:hypothetical protein